MKRGWLIAACCALVVTTGCSGDDTKKPGTGSGEPAPVKLSLQVDSPVTIGMLVTLRSAPGEGAAVLPGAEGARVASYRYSLGDSDVKLVVADDAGTAQGADKAVTKLIDKGATGIIAATDGEHAIAGLAAASGAGVPVIAPYLTTETTLPEGVWVTGPEPKVAAATLQAALDKRSVRTPYVLTADGVANPIPGSQEGAVTAPDAAGAAKRIQQSVRTAGTDAVVVAAATQTQAAVVAALQGRVPELPIFLTSGATSGDFVDDLVAAGGTPADELVTVGLDAHDTTTLAQGEQADAAAAFFSALRLAAGAEDVTDIFGSAAFESAAGKADIPSHDAVVALASAVQAADSVEPDKVRKALAELSLNASDGLAGPPLDFTRSYAVAADDVLPLYATTENAGVLPASVTDQGLHWFAGPK